MLLKVCARKGVPLGSERNCSRFRTNIFDPGRRVRARQQRSMDVFDLGFPTSIQIQSVRYKSGFRLQASDSRSLLIRQLQASSPRRLSHPQDY